MLMDIAKQSHNLQIMIVDKLYHIIIDDNDLLESIYAEFVNKKISKQGTWLDTTFEIHLFWKKNVLTEIQGKFMGPLFICSPYSDKLLYEATKNILQEIENKLKLSTKNKNWKIIFHISKLLEHMDKNFELTII
jgi:hypothetical protein